MVTLNCHNVNSPCSMICTFCSLTQCIIVLQVYPWILKVYLTSTFFSWTALLCLEGKGGRGGCPSNDCILNVKQVFALTTELCESICIVMHNKFVDFCIYGKIKSLHHTRLLSTCMQYLKICKQRTTACKYSET